jgi:hypothetical protein
MKGMSMLGCPRQEDGTQLRRYRKKGAKKMPEVADYFALALLGLCRLEVPGRPGYENNL